MSNDMRLGLLLGVGLVVGAAVVYYNEDEKQLSNPTEVVIPPASVVVPAETPNRAVGDFAEYDRRSI